MAQDQHIIGTVTGVRYAEGKPSRTLYLTAAEVEALKSPGKAKSLPKTHPKYAEGFRFSVSKRGKRRSIRLDLSDGFKTVGDDVETIDGVTVQAESMASFLEFDAPTTALVVGRFPVDGSDAGPAADKPTADLISAAFRAMSAYRGSINIGRAVVAREVLS